MWHGLRRISPSSSAVLKTARSSGYALAVVISLTPESSSFLRQRRTRARVTSAMVTFYACRMALDDQPQLRELAAEYQQALTGVQGIDLIPLQWLHLTMQGIGFTDEISADELVALDYALTAELATIEPAAVEFRYLTVHPEAVFLKAHPAAVLYHLRSKMRHAVLSVLGPERFTEPTADRANSRLMSASGTSAEMVERNRSQQR